MKTVTFRPLQPGDGAFLSSIFRNNREYYEIFYDPEGRESAWEDRVRRFLRQDAVHHFIIHAADRPIGWLFYANLSARERELDILVLHPEHLAQGYGKAALSQFLQMCCEDHVETVYLQVNQSNTRAIRFYTSFGFEAFAEEVVPECNDAVDLKQYKMALKIRH